MSHDDKKELISSHILMFPFRFDYVLHDNNKKYDREFSFYKNISVEKRLNIEGLLKKLGSDDSDWEYTKFDLGEIMKNKETKYYSEFAYFYDYAREALYNMQDFALDNPAFKSELSYYFESKRFNDKNKKKTNRFIIETPDEVPKIYDLQIDGLSLRVFDTGIAILSIELHNYDYTTTADVKAINEYGRRFYPQYLGIDKKGNITKPDFLPKSITIRSEGEEYIMENFLYDSLVDGETNEIFVGKHISELLGKCFTQDLNKPEHFYIQPILDDRMFVIGWYGSDAFVSRVKPNNAYTYDNSWYEYVFVDKHGGCTVQNEWMKYQLISDATYDRWSNYSTLYGITRYSFVVLTGSMKTLKKNYADYIPTHTNTMYFQMMLLVLAIRASILRFSDEVAAVATLADEKEEKRLKLLYEKYLSFYNRLYFKEVTHQDQGIELYDMALRQMKIVEHIEKLDGKFVKLHDLVALKANNREVDAMNNLTKFGTALILPGLLISIFGMDSLKNTYFVQHFGVITAVLSSVVSFFAVSYFTNKGGKK